MSKKEISRLRELSEQELSAELLEAKKELFGLKSQWMITRQLANPARLKTLRHQIARIKTVLHQREVKGEVSNA